jgi:predicted DsbA family dithiol-disulfide isomerase
MAADPKARDVLIWSDYLCPFCRLGQSLGAWLQERFDAHITWLPFDLHPEYPPEGLPRAELVQRYGDAFHDRLAARFAEEGLAFAPNPDVVPNTLTALRLTELARDHGQHDVFHDRLMDAYWRDGVNLSDRDELRRLAHDLPAGEVERVLTTDAYRDRIVDSTRQAQTIGVTGVPGFLLGGRLLVLGAHPHETFEQVYAQLAA